MLSNQVAAYLFTVQFFPLVDTKKGSEKYQQRTDEILKKHKNNV